MIPSKRNLYKEWCEEKKMEIEKEEEKERMNKGRELTMEEIKEIRKRLGNKLDVYHVVTILPYIRDRETMKEITQVGKKYEYLYKELRANPYEIVTKSDKEMFSHVDTLKIYTPKGVEEWMEKLREEKEKGVKVPRELNKEEREYMRVHRSDLGMNKTRLNRLALLDYNVSHDKHRTGISMNDIGRVVAPVFKEVTNIEVELDPWYKSQEKGGKELKFVQDNDMKSCKKAAIKGEAMDMAESGDEIITIPEEWKYIPRYGFSSGLFKYVKMHENIKIIKGFAFYNCEYLVQIVIPRSVLLIEREAFEECINLREVIFLEERTKKIKISDFVFSTCEQLKRIRFPDRCEEIGNMVLMGCIRLEYVHFPKMYPRKDEILSVLLLEGCRNMKKIEISRRCEKDKVELVEQLGLPTSKAEEIEIVYI